MVVIEGFDLPSSSNNDVDTSLQAATKKKKGGGSGFQSMDLSKAMFKGIMKKGYQMPSPIQRKAIPLIMEGHDVVAMARTGSGKTAAFLVPLFERLKSHSPVPGARALILSPTRELALQTLKFTQELGMFHDLKAAVVLGGDSFDNQFSALHEGPDIILATPGRFMHVCMEMALKLDKVQYVVFDEADRLFEMGFHEQLLEIIKRLPEDRQTLLFSATLPKVLVDFSKAGLSDPKLVRLDVENKLSQQLKLAFVKCQSEDKPALLLHLLQKVLEPHHQTVVFCATKHHVDYLHLLLDLMGISNTYIYSSLDQSARVLSTDNFRHKKVHVLLVTDLAARGIDIPLLDNVINYNFPAKPKLFVHRVGRVARAGRTGTAYSLVNVQEMPYVMDLHLFLGMKVKFVPPSSSTSGDDHGYIGSVDYTTLEDSNEYITRLLEDNDELCKFKKSASNGYKQYLKSCGQSSKESRARFKAEKHREIGVHPVLQANDNNCSGERMKILNDIKNYKAKQTIFEFHGSVEDKSVLTMKRKRKADEKTIHKYRNKMEAEASSKHEAEDTQEQTAPVCSLVESTEDDLIPLLESTQKSRKKLKQTEDFRDDKFYIPHFAADHHSERGLQGSGSFAEEARGAVINFTADDDQMMRKQRSQLKWDKKKKKFVHEGQDGKKRKVRTEAGVWIPASYKTDKYQKWKERNKVDHKEGGEEEEEKQERVYGGRNSWKNNKGKRGIQVLNNIKKPGAKVNPEQAFSKKKTNPRKELKSNDQVISKRAFKIERQIKTLRQVEAKRRKRSKRQKN